MELYLLFCLSSRMWLHGFVFGVTWCAEGNCEKTFGLAEKGTSGTETVPRRFYQGAKARRRRRRASANRRRNANRLANETQRIFKSKPCPPALRACRGRRKRRLCSMPHPASPDSKTAGDRT